MTRPPARFPRRALVAAALLGAALTEGVAPAPLGAQDSSATGDAASTAGTPAARTPAATRLRAVDYLDWEDVQEPQLAPDGRQVVYTRRWVDKLNDRWESSLWIMGADGTRNRFFVNGSNARWSPDGTRLAYIAKGEPAGTQLFVKYLDGSGETQITRLDQTPENLEWSPDGKTLAFRMLVLQRDDWKLEMPSAPKGAKWTEAPRVVTRLSYRRDRQGFVDDGYRQIFTVSADGGTPRQLTAGMADAGEPRWTPDGRRIVFSGNRNPEAEHQWRESDIYAVDVAGCAPNVGSAGCPVQQLTKRAGPDGNPVVSPDGRMIAYTGFDASDDTWVDAKLYVMGIDGSNPRVLNGTMDRTPQGLMWASDNSGVYFNAESEGTRNLYFAPVGGGTPRAVTRGARVQTVSDVGRGVGVGVMSTATRPNDVVLVDLRAGTEKWLTEVNADVLAGKELARTDELWVTMGDGTRVQGWLMKPPGFDPSKKYPLMLDIHGGPHAMYNPGFNFARQDHAANGYVVLWTNPRGSTGYGSAFGNAIKNAYPGKDYDDLMASVDSALGRGYVDQKNLFVYGCSGGGVLTAWIVGHTDRFNAASSNCPVINWMSFVGTTDGPSWYRNFAKLPWEDPSEHLKRSPLMYVGNVKTPTMLMTGVNDLRTPISQTEEFYTALKFRKVPTAMIRFNEEWHGTSSKPSNFLRTQLYLRSWFQRYATKGSVATVQD
jgi:dipeptidyl aminopeptidase/acylaminoacyl peptidase